MANRWHMVLCGLCSLDMGSCGRLGLDGSLDTIEKALQAVSPHLPNKAARTAWHCGVGFPECTEGKY